MPVVPGAGWIAIGEIAARSGTGLLVSGAGLDDEMARLAWEVFAAAMQAGEPPDVAALTASRAMKKHRRGAGGLRWLAPAGSIDVSR